MRFHVKLLQDAFSCLDEARMPVVAAIQGGCVGGAVDMTSACDIRYCAADAFFVIQEINIGMTADVGTFPRLCKLIPEGWVRELAYTGRRLPEPGPPTATTWVVMAVEDSGRLPRRSAWGCAAVGSGRG